MSEAERADTRAFLREILQILPLVGLKAFEIPTPLVISQSGPATSFAAPIMSNVVLDTIVVPAQLDGFKKVFLGENCWYAIRIAGGMIPKIKYIAAYRTQPDSAVTHYAPVAAIEPYGNKANTSLFSVSPPKR